MLDSVPIIPPFSDLMMKCNRYDFNAVDKDRARERETKTNNIHPCILYASIFDHEKDAGIRGFFNFNVCL